MALALFAACGSGSPQERFLTQNSQREGVQTTASGLQYEILEEGTGPKPTVEDVVTVHYEGKLVDDTVFDSSYGRGPATFPLAAVVPGWKEGIPLMSVGSKHRLVIPPALGYGSRNMGPIPPDSVLIFEVELLGIQGR